MGFAGDVVEGVGNLAKNAVDSVSNFAEGAVEGITGSEFLGDLAGLYTSIQSGNWSAAGENFVDLLSGDELSEQEQQLGELAKQELPPVAKVGGLSL